MTLHGCRSGNGCLMYAAGSIDFFFQPEREYLTVLWGLGIRSVLRQLWNKRCSVTIRYRRMSDGPGETRRGDSTSV